MVLFLLSFKDLTDSYGKSSRRCRKADGESWLLVKKKEKRIEIKIMSSRMLHVTTRAGMVEDDRQYNSRGRSHYTKARQRGRNLLQHVTDLFNKKGQQTLTDVSANSIHPHKQDLITGEMLPGDVWRLLV